MLDMLIKINCVDAEEQEIIKKEIYNFVRRVRHIKKEKINYEVWLVNLESGQMKIIRNKKSLENQLPRQKTNQSFSIPSICS